MAKETEAQKRRRRLQEKRRKEHEGESLAYLGSRYQNEACVPLWMATETGIYQAFVISEFKLFDNTVATALESLIKQLRRGPLPAMSEVDGIKYTVGLEEELVEQAIRLGWKSRFSDPSSRPSRDDFEGVTRSVLGSLTKMRTPSAQSRAYLRHIEGFLTRKLGIVVQQVDREGIPLEKPREDLWLQSGQHWIHDGDLAEAANFQNEALRLIESGQTEHVQETCTRLMSELSDPAAPGTAQLMELILQARRRGLLAAQ